jgi:sirohydrochlorin cobaltochelatase
MSFGNPPAVAVSRLGGGCGLLVVGHGTADPVGASEAETVTAHVAAMLPDVPVELGYLEVIEPSIAVAVNRLVTRGCRELVAMPLLLFTAGHARRDVPEALTAAAEAAGVAFRMAEPFGIHSEIVGLSRRRREEAIAAGSAGGIGERAVLLMVGRGASDPETPAQLRAFTGATLDESDAGRFVAVEQGFVAAARPSLDEAVVTAAERAAALGAGRVVVQPHLLFSGHVERQVAAAVDRGRRLAPHLEWLQVDRLGADEAVARAVVHRVAEAAAFAQAGLESLSRQA